MVEDLLGVVGSVEVAYSGVVSAYDEVGAAEVFSDDGVEDGFAGACVAHFEGEDGHYY